MKTYRIYFSADRYVDIEADYVNQNSYLLEFIKKFIDGKDEIVSRFNINMIYGYRELQESDFKV